LRGMKGTKELKRIQISLAAPCPGCGRRSLGSGVAGAVLGLGEELVPELELLVGDGGGSRDGHLGLEDEGLRDVEAGAEDDAGYGLGVKFAAAEGGDELLETVVVGIVLPEVDFVAKDWALRGGRGVGWHERFAKRGWASRATGPVRLRDGV